MNFNIDNMVQKVTETLTTETVIGEKIEIGGVVLIPIMTASFGFGGGAGDGNEQGKGSGGGGGARLSVAGMVVVKGDEVSFLPTGKAAGKSGAVDKFLDALPGLVEKVNVKTKTSKEKDESDAS